MGWSGVLKVHVHVHTSSTLTSHLVILVDTSGVRQGYVRGKLGVGEVGWSGVLRFMYMFIHHRL